MVLSGSPGLEQAPTIGMFVDTCLSNYICVFIWCMMRPAFCTCLAREDVVALSSLMLPAILLYYCSFDNGGSYMFGLYKTGSNNATRD